jgi:hypothetical protein
MSRSMFAKVCLAIAKYEDRVKGSPTGGGCCASWSEFLTVASEDISDICYEIADQFIETFPEYTIYNNEDADEDMMTLCFELGQKWFKFVSELEGGE